MLIVALLPFAKPRETLSGLLGRYAGRYMVARIGVRVIDAMHFWEDAHCAEVEYTERRARVELGYEE